MRTYEFSIIASGLDPSDEQFEARFYDAGCDDALVSFQRGRIIVDFAREASSIEEAISSAIENVLAAGATVERVEPDPLVSLTEIASRTGLTRAAVTQYAKGQRASGFPGPVARVTSGSPLWDWVTVSRWLYSQKKLSRDEVIEAQVVKAVNDALGTGGLADLRKSLKVRARECEAAL
ncbi:helix-turn-helix transcriptional regulator [Lutibaculum baratangense]|uniref:Putative DNA-binding protein n=1 Tax=Lutibaculum baratangense AMV1 TaxID=631454 RepID=V4T875_9HYPH|nr:hypothetical protein [Lutibaculum baratangense]ESR22793.1 putative DNA-binding protein [Lutibaculum baratangense AMV1]